MHAHDAHAPSAFDARLPWYQPNRDNRCRGPTKSSQPVIRGLMLESPLATPPAPWPRDCRSFASANSSCITVCQQSRAKQEARPLAPAEQRSSSTGCASTRHPLPCAVSLRHALMAQTLCMQADFMSVHSPPKAAAAERGTLTMAAMMAFTSLESRRNAARPARLRSDVWLTSALLARRCAQHRATSVGSSRGPCSAAGATDNDQ